MPFVSSVRGTFGPQSENRGVSNAGAIAEILRQDPNSPSLPTGGTITVAGGYRIHTFVTGNNTGATYTFNTTNLGTTQTMEYLIVGGGAGGAGGGLGGGGGAGGYLSGSTSVPAASYSVVVGSGNNDTPFAYHRGEQGGNSSVFGITATGGGVSGTWGGSPGLSPHHIGGPGGSGGGASSGDSPGHNAAGGGGAGAAGGPGKGGLQPSYYGGAGIPGQGHPGGTGGNQCCNVGAGAGGAGLSSSITGTSVTRGGGGGGGSHQPGHNNTGGPAGAGGGGRGGNADQYAPAFTDMRGTPGTGGGGGGAGHGPGSSTSGGGGGSGIVVIRYPV